MIILSLSSKCDREVVTGFVVRRLAKSRLDERQALVGIARVPTVYAVAAAMVVLGLGMRMPIGVMRPIEMLSDAAGENPRSLFVIHHYSARGHEVVAEALAQALIARERD